MLAIEGNISLVVRTAMETDSVESLCDKLAYLHAYGESARWETNVRMIVMENSVGGIRDIALVFFPERELNRRIYGGLCRCESTNKWTVNT